jgi:predicted MPP superfamily phosphohydrolase
MKRRYIVLLGIAGFLTYSGLIEPNWIGVTTRDITIQGFGPDTLRIVHIADVHTTKQGYRETRALEMIRAIDPDYIFFTGDLLKAHGSLEPGLEFMKGLKSQRGTYFVLGNADLALSRAIKAGRVALDSPGFTILINQSADCGPFTLVGLGDPVSGLDDVEKAFEGADELKPVFVLTHFHPDSLLASLERYKVDMVFSGHTHGGQFGLPFMVRLVPYAARSKYMDGLFFYDGFILSVTRGLGTNIFPLRFLSRPEIVVYELHGE